MSIVADDPFREVWDALRADNSHRDDALNAVRIAKLRGIWDLRIPLEYPVSVLAGPNGSGKSTVLFACACAYQVPSSPRRFTPSSLFPNFTTRQDAVSSDAPQQTEIEFEYLHHGNNRSMTWRRRRSWTRSFPRRNDGPQPERPVYLRTLANLTNPSEVRSVLQLGRKRVETETVSEDLLIFAHRILPWRYRNLAILRHGTNDLLFAAVDGAGETRYSEFHMSSGERSVLRISKDISRLENALVLIDEIDTGLHPYTQEQTMLELQRAALRQKLQIVVASHSPVILDSVPPEARIFLDRDDETGQVRRARHYRDIFQKALYGQSRDRLSILCEDVVAEGVILGVFDVLNARLDLRHEDVVIGRNTGRNEFPGHIGMLAKFDKLSGFIVVLDGDSRAMEDQLRKIAEKHRQVLHLLFLPGNSPPEPWIWDALAQRTDEYGPELGLAAADLRKTMQAIERQSEGTVRRRNTTKVPVTLLADKLQRTVPDVARIVGRHEAERNAIADLLAGFKTAIDQWRRL